MQVSLPSAQTISPSVKCSTKSLLPNEDKYFSATTNARLTWLTSESKIIEEMSSDKLMSLNTNKIGLGVLVDKISIHSNAMHKKNKIFSVFYIEEYTNHLTEVQQIALLSVVKNNQSFIFFVNQGKESVKILCNNKFINDVEEIDAVGIAQFKKDEKEYVVVCKDGVKRPSAFSVSLLSNVKIVPINSEIYNHFLLKMIETTKVLKILPTDKVEDSKSKVGKITVTDLPSPKKMQSKSNMPIKHSESSARSISSAQNITPRENNTAQVQGFKATSVKGVLLNPSPSVVEMAKSWPPQSAIQKRTGTF